MPKEFSGKNGSKLAQRSPTNALADVTKINKLKMVFRTNRRSLKYAPKEFSKVNACARDHLDAIKHTQYSRQHRSVTHANLEWYVLTVSQLRRALWSSNNGVMLQPQVGWSSSSTLDSELVSTVNWRPIGRSSVSAFWGCWFDLLWWRLRYPLLMRPNKVETAVPYVGVCGIFW